MPITFQMIMSVIPKVVTIVIQINSIKRVLLKQYKTYSNISKDCFLIIGIFLSIGALGGVLISGISGVFCF